MTERIFLPSPVGVLMLACSGGALTQIAFAPGQTPTDPAVDRAPVLRAAAAQLGEYFTGQRREFTLPLCPRGTAFEMEVWRALCRIPYGEVRSYAQIAAAIGNPGACRAVGGANHRNPLAIVIPCHRVITANGRLGGYGGGADIKRHLLALEGVRLCDE